jgi:hypothetical protein
MNQSKKQRLQFEGIDINDSLTVHREQTCDVLLQDLTQEHVILIRGPPFSGKTSLATLVFERAKRDTRFNHVVKFTMLINDWTVSSTSHAGVSMSLQQLCTTNDWRTSLGNVLIIVDEIQVLYNERDSVFWSTIKLIQQRDPNFNTMVVLMLGSYGGESVRGENVTPTQFDNPRGLELIRFSKSEYEELVQSFNTRVENENFALDSETSEALYNFTMGIPGLTVLALQQFESNYLNSNSMSTQAPKKDDFITFLLGSFVKRCVDTRAITKAWVRDPDAISLVNKLLKDESFQPGLGNDDVVTQLIKEGILARYRNEVVFSAPIVRCIVSILISSQRRVDVEFWEIDNFYSFLNCCLKSMSHSRLKNTLSAGSSEKIYERLLQMEFYNAAVPFANELGGMCCPDAGAIFGSTGYLDFYINSTRQWGFELTRNSSLLEEHVSRFCPTTGKYKSIPMKSWGVINFVQCKGKFRKPVGVSDGEVRVLWSKDHSSIQVYRKSNDSPDVTVEKLSFAN